MSEPIKKIKQAPESFAPKNKPIILNMMEEAQTQTNMLQQLKEVSKMEFRIEIKESFQIMGLSGYETENTEREGEVTGVWAPFTADYDKKLRDYYTEPYWQVGASSKKYVDGKMKLTIGAEYKGKMIEGMDIETIPEATYAVFSFEYPVGYSIYEENYAKILNEWFPTSGYKRDEDSMDLEVYGDHWEIWIPVIK